LSTHSSSNAGTTIIRTSRPRDHFRHFEVNMEGERHFDVSLCGSTLSSTHPSSHHKSTPIRRNEHTPWLRHRPIQTTNLLFLIFLTCCLSLSSATVYIEEQMVETQDDGSDLDDLALSGALLVDPAYPIPNRWTLDNSADDLKRRDGFVTIVSSTPTSTDSGSASTTVASSSTSSGLLVATPLPTGELPTPFDLGFSNNITSSCQSFMNNMLSNSTFKACLPFSLLLQVWLTNGRPFLGYLLTFTQQNSNSFFQAEKSVVRITQTLDYTCAADFATCSTAMAQYASNITTSAACETDLASENPLISYARLGLLAYQPLYRASCLKNPDTSSYCFADAITNSSNPANSYIYFLPLNTTLVGGSQPTCNTCLKQTMDVFEAATSDRKSALATDYVSAAMQVNVNCGPGFVNASLATAVSSGAQPSQPFSNVGLFALVVLVASWLL
jgi:hypothetical protein